MKDHQARRFVLLWVQVLLEKEVHTRSGTPFFIFYRR